MSPNISIGNPSQEYYCILKNQCVGEGIAPKRELKKSDRRRMNVQPLLLGPKRQTTERKSVKQSSNNVAVHIKAN